VTCRDSCGSGRARLLCGATGKYRGNAVVVKLFKTGQSRTKVWMEWMTHPPGIQRCVFGQPSARESEMEMLCSGDVQRVLWTCGIVWKKEH